MMADPNEPITCRRVARPGYAAVVACSDARAPDSKRIARDHGVLDFDAPVSKQSHLCRYFYRAPEKRQQEVDVVHRPDS